MKIKRRCIIFLLILMLLLTALSWWFNRQAVSMAGYIPGRSGAFAGIASEPKDSIDVVVVGDSESYTSISPLEIWREQGISSYVCGQGGQRVQETYYVLKEALKHQSPKVVLLETNLMFRDPGLLGNMQVSVTEFLRSHFKVLRYHNLWKLLVERNITDEAYKGFTIREEIQAFDSEEEYMKETSGIQEIPKSVYIYMEKIIELCRKNDAELVLYSAPSPRNYNYVKHNALEKYASEKGLHYVDLNLKAKDLGIDWKQDSYDKGDHLNLYGARKVTAYMGKYLGGRYGLEDRRDDPAYQEWDVLAGQYYKKAYAEKGEGE